MTANVDERQNSLANWLFGDWHAILRRIVLPLALLATILLLVVFGSNWLGVQNQRDVEALIRAARSSIWSPAIVAAVFTLVGFTGFPQFMLQAAAVVIFGPLLGFLYAWLGTVFSSCVGFWVGHFMGAEALRRFGGERVNRVSAKVGDHGILASAIVRVLPTAPFVVVNMAAGVSHINFFKFFLGTLIGVIPKAAVVALLGKNLLDFIRERDPMDLAVMVLVLGVWVLLGLVIRRFVKRA